jgi:hypothetical protein
VNGRGRLKSSAKEIAGLCALSAGAFLVHGYHPFSEDAETYLPGIEKILHPRLFPAGDEYFEAHAHLTLFPHLISFTVERLHIPFDWSLLLWQVASFFLFLFACWHLARRVFPGRRAAWAGVALVAALFTMPVAGTALYVMDPFLNPRNIIAFAVIFAIVNVLERRYVWAVVFLVFGISVHPLMTAFAVSFCILYAVIDRWPQAAGVSKTLMEKRRADPALPAVVLMLSPIKGLFEAPTKAYEMVALNHRYQFLTRWTWYELLGALAPIAIFWGFSEIGRVREWRNLQLVSRTMTIYGAIYFVIGLTVSIPHRLEAFSLVQPMRSLQLLYTLLLLFGGGLLAEYVLRNRAWRWIALFLPLSAGMCYAQRALYPASRHIEWPGLAPRNQWTQAFLWARNNTPDQAVFAIDPYYMSISGEDSHGFRAIAQRSQLADGEKDSGVVELFPTLGNSWMAQVGAQKGIEHFQREQFVRLRQQFGATWVILLNPDKAELDCPYRNSAVAVCRIPAAASNQ